MVGKMRDGKRRQSYQLMEQLATLVPGADPEELERMAQAQMAQGYKFDYSRMAQKGPRPEELSQGVVGEWFQGLEEKEMMSTFGSLLGSLDDGEIAAMIKQVTSRYMRMHRCDTACPHLCCLTPPRRSSRCSCRRSARRRARRCSRRRRR